MKNPENSLNEKHVANPNDLNNLPMMMAAEEEMTAMITERDKKNEMFQLNREKEKLYWDINLKVLDNPKLAQPRWAFENDDDVLEKRKRMVQIEYDMMKMTWAAQDEQQQKMNAMYEEQIQKLGNRIHEIKESEENDGNDK